MFSNYKSILLVSALGISLATVARPAYAQEVETRLYTGACGVQFGNETPNQAGFLASLLGAVVPSLISGAYDRLTTYLDEQAKDKNFTTSAYINAEFGANPKWDCMHLVRGVFDSTTAYAPSNVDAATRNRFQQLGIPVTSPQLFIEARIVMSSDRTAWTVLPTYALYGSTVEAGKVITDTRNLSLVVNVRGPGAAENSKESSSAIVPLGDRPTKAAGIVFRMPAVDSGADTNVLGTWGSLENTNGIVASPWSPSFVRTSTQKGVPLPYTVSVSLTETRPGSKLAKFLSSILKPAKPVVQAAAENLLIPGKAEAAELAAFEASTNAVKAFNSAYADWQTAKVNYCGASTAATPDGKKDRIAKAKSMSDAEAAILIAAAKASVQSPVVKPVPVSDALPDPAICGA